MGIQSGVFYIDSNESAADAARSLHGISDSFCTIYEALFALRSVEQCDCVILSERIDPLLIEQFYRLYRELPQAKNALLCIVTEDGTRTWLPHHKNELNIVVFDVLPGALRQEDVDSLIDRLVTHKARRIEHQEKVAVRVLVQSMLDQFSHISRRLRRGESCSVSLSVFREVSLTVRVLPAHLKQRYFTELLRQIEAREQSRYEGVSARVRSKNSRCAVEMLEQVIAA